MSILISFNWLINKVINSIIYASVNIKHYRTFFKIKSFTQYHNLCAYQQISFLFLLKLLELCIFFVKKQIQFQGVLTFANVMYISVQLMKQNTNRYFPVMLIFSPCYLVSFFLASVVKTNLFKFIFRFQASVISGIIRVQPCLLLYQN